MKQALVLDINELYRVIPEAKALEGKNFKDVRELLKDLIQAVESTGRWQFIQYVSNKPSLFIVRELENKDIDISKLKKKLESALATAENAVSNIQAVIPQEAPSVYQADPAPDVYSNKDFDETQEVVEHLGSKVPETKLPWE